MKLYGSFCLVLHFHLPYVLSHGRWPHGMDWLNEACAETYLPLLQNLYRLIEEGHSPKLTISITPVLAEQLSHPSFREEFTQYLKNKIDISGKDEEQFAFGKLSQCRFLAEQWKKFYADKLSFFKEKCKGSILSCFRELQDKGHIEIITSAATHGYFPLLSKDASIQAQIKQAISSYQRLFGRRPRGFWLPECGYRPAYEWRSPLKERGHSYRRKGVEQLLSENNLDYFIIDTPLLKGGKTIGVYIHRFKALESLWKEFQKQYRPPSEKKEVSPYGVYLVGPLQKDRPSVAVFTRDAKTGFQVWSGKWGYPGDGWYLEFHKKHFPGGNRYWRVTSSETDLGKKEEYYPERAQERIEENASHFKELVKSTLEEYHQATQNEGVLCAPFDAELFGHWWFEGPNWLYFVLKWIDSDPKIRLSTCSEFLDKHLPTHLVSLPEGSWGEGGFHWIWLNQWTEWTWKHIYEAEERMEELVQKYIQKNDPVIKKLLQQLGRELLLLQSSDWQFLISTWTARDYGEARVTEHYEAFKHLAEIINKYTAEGKLEPADETFLEFCRERDDLFEDIQPQWFM